MPYPGGAQLHGTLLRIPLASQVTTIGSTDNIGTPNNIVVNQQGIFYCRRSEWGNVEPFTGSAVYKVTPDGKVPIIAGCPPHERPRQPVHHGRRWQKNIMGRATAASVTTTITAPPADIDAAPDGNTHAVRGVRTPIYDFYGLIGKLLTTPAKAWRN